MFPIAETLRLSLFEWNLLSRNKPFVGLENFRELFQDDQFLDAIINTAAIAFGAMAVTIPVSMVLAAVIYHRTRSRFAGFYETAVFIPHVVSLVPAAMAWKWVFDAKLGPLNRLIVAFGGEAQPWLFDPVLSVICIILLVSWQTLGYGVLIYLVGFRNLPKSVYEAARLDGANGVQSFFFMSVPLLKIHLNSGVSLKTRWKFSNVGSFGRMVGGQTRISWGVLKPFAISSSSGSSSSTQMTNNIMSRRRFFRPDLVLEDTVISAPVV